MRRLSPLLMTLAVVAVVGCGGQPRLGQDGAIDARVASGKIYTWDPGQAADAGSAEVIAQVFEGLTAFDAESNVQPALADSWRASEDGRQITFHLRPGIAYSDGSPITAQDVVASWLRLIDPVRPSLMSSLVADIQGATDYQQGLIGPEGVGLHADGDQVVVDLRRPATYFLSVTASPSMAVVPPSMYGQLDTAPPANIVVSGAYVPSIPDADVIRLTGNTRYWAGTPPLDVVELVTDFGDGSRLQAFQDGAIDYTGISAFDASWIAYDTELGPQLRQSTDFSLRYYGFETRAAPFDNPLVRLAFAKAVDWDRMVRLADDVPATSMIPPGIPGRDDPDYRPSYEPEVARQLLADADYPGGVGFPTVVLATYGVGFEQTVAAEIEANLGIQVEVETHDFEEYIAREYAPGAPGIWTQAWNADYPHPHDFLGLLLETGSRSNEGGWSNAEYDALIEQAAATDDPAQQLEFYSRAQEILAREAPVVPLSYNESWALARDGLLGAQVAGVGIIRIAGLDWAPGTGR